MSLVEGKPVNITEAEYVSGYQLRLRFSDGYVKVIDFEPFLRNSRSPQTREFLDLEKFRAYSIPHGNLVWRDYDMCFAIEDLYEGFGPLSSKVERRIAPVVAEDGSEYGRESGMK